MTLGAVSAVSQRLTREPIAVGSGDTVNFNLQQSLTDHTNYYFANEMESYKLIFNVFFTILA